MLDIVLSQGDIAIAPLHAVSHFVNFVLSSFPKESHHVSSS